MLVCLAGVLFFWSASRFKSTVLGESVSTEGHVHRPSPHLVNEIALRYEGLGQSELRDEAERFFRSYDALLESVSTVAFDAGMYEQTPIRADGAIVHPSCSAFPPELLLHRVTESDVGRSLHVLALDREQFPEVWDAYFEAEWLRARIPDAK